MSGKPDYLVSICLVKERHVAAELAALAALDHLARQSLQYWEIVYVASESSRQAVEDAIDVYSSITNLRIVIVPDAVGYYASRTVAASEAIGDVVVITSFSELQSTNVFEFAEEAVASRRIVIARSARRSGSEPIYDLIGLISDFRVDARDLKTIALPRDLLVAVLARPTANVDLRFEPKRGMAPFVRKEMPQSRSGGEADFSQRLDLLAAVFSASASRFLSAFAMVSAGVTMLALAYGGYALAIIAIAKDVQPGWFSTAIVQSGATAFFAFGLAVIALGVASIIDRLQASARPNVVEEIGNITFYDKTRELNVEVASGGERKAG